MSIHPTAIIGADVELDPSVEVGAFSVLMGKTKIGKGCKISTHVSIGSEFGYVEIGNDNQFAQGSVIGGPPQDLKYNNEPTKLVVGSGNRFREYVTLNLGTVTGREETRVGDNNLMMAYCHLAHDVFMGNHVVIANGCNIAGHVDIEDHVTIGGMSAMSQFARLGKYAYIAGISAMNKDVLPFSMASGTWGHMRATNKIGLERGGFPKDEIREIHKAIRFVIKGTRTTEEAVEKIQGECRPSENIEYLLNFIKNSERGLAR